MSRAQPTTSDPPPHPPDATLAAELTRARAELARTRAALAARNADVAVVLRAAGHDLKSPLKTLTGFIEMIAAERSSPLLEASRELAAGLADLCETILEYAEIGGHEPTLERQPLRPILGRALDTLLLDISDRGAHIDGADTDVELHADAHLLQLALCHLLDNAIGYAGAHKPPRVAIETHTHADGALVIAIEDDGPGIPEAERDRVLQPLVRLRDTPDPPGHGLGLAKVRRACDVMGATLRIVDPHSLGGCRVEITLPPPPDD